MAIMNQIKELEDGTVTVPVFSPSTVDNELMKGYKSDSLSASLLGPM